MTNPCKFPNWIILLIYFVSMALLSPHQLTSANTDDVVEQLKQLQSDYIKLNGRVSSLEMENKGYKQDIRFLRIKLSEIQKSDEIVNHQNDDNIGIENAMAMTWPKRAARLFPAQKKDEDTKPIIGPPSSCQDLNKMGHSSNAIYMIKSHNSSKINAVFCDFKPGQSSSPSSTVVENNFGYIDVKSASGVYFYVQAIGNQSVPGNDVLRFDVARLNVGNGMNLKSGVFTAPKTGTYAFMFSVIKSAFDIDFLDVYLRLNGTRLGYSVVSLGVMAIPTALQATLKLKRGDRVDLQKSKKGKLAACYVGYCHHFTGWMLEEDLEI